MSELLMQAAESPLVEKEPAPSVIFAQHGESSLDFDLRAFVAEPEKMFAARDQINKAINRILTANDIEIPFPQRDVHVRSGELAGNA